MFASLAEQLIDCKNRATLVLFVLDGQCISTIETRLRASLAISTCLGGSITSAASPLFISSTSVAPSRRRQRRGGRRGRRWPRGLLAGVDPPRSTFNHSTEALQTTHTPSDIHPTFNSLTTMPDLSRRRVARFAGKDNVLCRVASRAVAFRQTTEPKVTGSSPVGCIFRLAARPVAS